MGSASLPPRRAGYALLAVLWICVGIAALTFLISAAGRGAIAPARNRIALTAASWNAEACLAHARAVLADALMEQALTHRPAAGEAWNRLDRLLTATPAPRAFGCELSLRAVGSRLDVNASDTATLARLFLEMGMRTGQADSAAAALSAARPFVDTRQLHPLPQLESTPALDGVLDVEPGPIALNHAPAEVLALLPGFTEETVQRVIDARRRDAPITTFGELSELLSPEVPDASARLPALVVFEPTAWVLAARSTVGQPPVAVVVEARLARSGGSAAVVRRRSWIQ
ncbi:MAG: hypothetical protein ACREKS_15930 [Candidatus Rokuibacteriota bacterium]